MPPVISSYLRKIGCATLGLLLTSSSFMPLSAIAGPAQQYKGYAPKGGYSAPTTYRRPQKYMADTLLIMPAGKVTDEQIHEVCQANDCELEDEIGKGPYRILIVKTQKGKLEKTEAALRKDKHIWLMQRNYEFEPMQKTMANEDVVKNGLGGTGSFLRLVHADAAWKLGVTGAGQTIAVADSGCNANGDELRGKCDKGYDATTWDAKLALASAPVATGLGVTAGLGVGALFGLGANVLANAVNPGCKVDHVSKNADGVSLNGHGTEVSTVAAGAINGLHCCGVAPDARIYPIRANNTTSVCAGMWHLISTKGPKILNISMGPYYADTMPIMFLMFRLYHDTYGGIIFLAGGNHGEQLGSRCSYANFVSMTNVNGKYLKTSAHGPCISFAAQGDMVDTVDMSNTDDASGGTSFASPTCAGVAALVWSANPNLTGDQVVLLMQQKAYLPAKITPDADKYGYGIPDAEASVKAALGLAKSGLGG
ncbi:MAG TPA: S8/S53 family peptidase [Drouetiella sp.]